ncbi:lipopolysaccharide-assembly, LptC-related [Variibacter gotjawalensis]|uniref:Lipopolysaccharide-assembly, LptC-related n=1 Tax=Variibacter gotjawalensis TaxID=1333996 RepID=A0A0S3PUY3_9BRAD|nr:LPS export ABC transporter periplasmic protein LptC [Variibacter gotjawalensis]NIK50107.1 lipopolysaccharide export system protein LptC [Variibacter gotjawalensis]RZS46106.1 lipopolysaccharide export system protein LptC [Variibacter gotjawalensis]BAT59781.1 lipopolysaccharide-assembly, LptC-related [Variibacter gotjawalensis]
MQLEQRYSAGDQTWRSDRGTARGRSFRSARRHSRWVRLLRYALPGIVGVVVVGYALFSWLNPFAALPENASAANMVISGTRVTMDLPKLAGYTRDGRHYELVATAATQDLKKPSLIELKDIRAKVEMRNGNSVDVRAAAGLYDTKAETVAMQDDVYVVSSSGTEIRLKEAMIDMRKGHVLSQRPVEVMLTNGRINAQGLEVSESGAVMNFTGGVAVEMNNAVPLAVSEGAR